MKAKQVTTPSLVSPVASSSSSTSTLSQQQSGFIVGSPVKGKEVRHSSSPQSSNVCTPSVIQQGDLTKTQFSGAPGMSMLIASLHPSFPFSLTLPLSILEPGYFINSWHTN